MSSLTMLDPAYDELFAQARAVAERLRPIAVAADASSDLHPEVLSILRESGLMRLTVPAAHGGASDTVDPVAICIVREALMGVCSAADSLFALQGIGSYAITVAGTPDQRAAWLPRVASGEVLAGLALTEPNAGSDLKAITTTARPAPDGSGDLVLDGHKSFISNAGVAGYYIVLAREESALSAFLVPADALGLSTEPCPELGAPHLLGDVILKAVRVPATARLGEPGRGLEPVLSTLAVFRISVAAAAVGLAQVALEEATRHARTREQFGRPLLKLGPVAGLLADAWAEVESTRLLTYRVAELAREDPRAHLEHSSLAKLAATEACSRVVDRWCRSAAMGVRRTPEWDDATAARPMRIYEGASEVLRLGITRQLAAEVS